MSRAPETGQTLSDAKGLAEAVRAGDRRAVARAITEVENQTELGLGALRILFPLVGHAHLIGITGSAGSGKSTLTTELARSYRRRGAGVAVVAVDPSSPFTRGAILGDRIRMQDLADDPGIFIRSVATRGSLGGLSTSTLDVATVLAASGREIILIETVGAGQDEVDVASVADTTLVLNTPGMGDDVQTIKAGIMEIADVLVVNKVDLPGADAVIAQLLALLSLQTTNGWQVPVVGVSSLRREGISELTEAIDQHRNYLSQTAASDRARRGKARQAILTALRAGIARRLDRSEPRAALDALVERVAAGALDPHSAAAELLGEIK